MVGVCCVGICVCDECFRQFPLVLLQMDYLFLNAVLGNESIGNDLFVLSDTMGTRYCLGFGGGIPPRVDDEDVICFCQIQANAFCLVLVLEGLDIFGSAETGDLFRTVGG